MQSTKIITNASIAILQVVVAGILLFLLYRYLLDTLGIEQLGVWSIVLATTSVSKISELGFSNSVIKFVSKYIARKEIKKAAEAIETAVISVGVFIGIMLCLAYYPVTKILAYILPEDSLGLALSILPLAFISLWINAVSGNILSGLDGYQRIDLRGLTMIVANILYFILAISIIPTYGLMGLAIAQLLQAIFIIITSAILLNKVTPEFSIIPHRWSQSLFKEMLKYGVNFQIATLMMLLFEPITKMLLSKYGNLSMVGYFEMANRMVLQIRSLLTSATQVLVPVIAGNHETDQESNKSLYQNLYQFTLYVCLIIYGVIFSILPIVSEAWIGKYESTFILFSSLAILAWFINTLSTPAYFANLGSGNLRWNTISHICMAVINVLFGVLLGSLYGGTGVVVAWMLALVISNLILIMAYQINHSIPLTNTFPKTNIILGLASILAIVLCWSMYFQYRFQSLFITTCLSLALFSIITLIPILVHPVRQKIFKWMFNK